MLYSLEFVGDAGEAFDALSLDVGDEVVVGVEEVFTASKDRKLVVYFIRCSQGEVAD